MWQGQVYITFQFFRIIFVSKCLKFDTHSLFAKVDDLASRLLINPKQQKQKTKFWKKMNSRRKGKKKDKDVFQGVAFGISKLTEN